MREGPRGDVARIEIIIDEYGIVTMAREDGKDIEDSQTGKKLGNSETRLFCPNICCWRKVNGQWRCSPSFC